MLSMNPLYPLSTPRSIDDLMGIALGMEREAALRYRQLGEQMEREGDAALAETFRELAALEEHHERGLAEWVKREDHCVTQPRHFHWRLPETFAEADLAGAPLSPYQALVLAVRNEEQAFSFYSYLAAMTEAQPALRLRAEALAREELSHLAQLRRFRRRAFHDARSQGEETRPAVADLPGFYRLSQGLEHGSAVLCGLLCDRLRGPGHEAAVLLLGKMTAEAESQAASAGVAGGDDPQAASRTAEEAILRGRPETPEITAIQAWTLCEKDAREVLDIYLGIAESARDAALLSAAQAAAELAMGRLATLRSLHDGPLTGD